MFAGEDGPFPFGTHEDCLTLAVHVFLCLGTLRSRCALVLTLLVCCSSGVRSLIRDFLHWTRDVFAGLKNI